MGFKFGKIIFMSAALSIFSFTSVSVSCAAVTMEEVGDLFMKETGRQWEEATGEERKKFLQEVLGREKREEREKRVREKKAPFYIQEGYRRNYDQDWDEAGQKDQEKYIQAYERSIEKKEREQNKRLEAIRRAEENRKRAEEKQKREIERKRIQKERAELKKKRALEKKRKDEKRRLEKKMRELRRKRR